MPVVLSYFVFAANLGSRAVAVRLVQTNSRANMLGVRTRYGQKGLVILVSG